MSRAPKKLPGEGRERSPFRGFINFILFLIVLGLLGWSLLFIAFAPELPDTSKIWRQDRGPGTIVLAADGSELARLGGFTGKPVGYHEFPEDLRNAVVATEDRRFFSHFGIDVVGLGRAAWRNLLAGRVVEGGSTLTQQLAKNLYLSSERTFNRKIQEMFLAVWLESRLTKQEILTIYLNRVYFGAGAYGVSSAARLYFNKAVKDLTLAESAMIAGLLKAPSRLAPTQNPEDAVDRASVVLSNMVAAGYVAPPRADQARNRPARVVSPKDVGGARHFVDWVIERLPDGLRATDRDLVVTTTLEPKVQRAAESAIAAALRANASRRVGEAALVALAADGRVRAMVGGRDYRASRYNRATTARRQPGSAFKPVVYAAALESRMRPDSTVDDSKVTVEGWSPVNFNGRYNGLMPMSEAFARSVNPAVVRLQERIGRARVIDVGRRLGITSELKPIPSLALGSMEVGVMELTQAYVPFVNRGLASEPYGIVEVRTTDGRRLYRYDPSQGRRAIHRQVAGDMKWMLQGAVVDGTGRGAAIPNAGVGGKTGTSQDTRDAWFIGFAGDTVAGIWFGNDNGAPMRGVTGGGLATGAWRAFMAPTLAAKPVAIRLPKPSVDATRSESGLEILAKITDLVIGKVTEGDAADGTPSESAETAKGVIRWFLDQVPAGEPSPYPEANTDQPREDMGR